MATYSDSVMWAANEDGTLGSIDLAQLFDDHGCSVEEFLADSDGSMDASAAMIWLGY